MSDKTAFIFDTNFILQNQRLDDVVKKLSDKYTPYVTQMSIEERIAQRCREAVKAIQEAKEMQEKHKGILTIQIELTEEEIETKWREDLKKSYSLIFGEKIIPFSTENNTLEFVINRANKKLPPFSDAKGASDKGFKDCIIWYSILEYFKYHGEDEILFLTDDDGFKKSDYLISEFKEVTGKTIEIKANSFYKELLGLIEVKENRTKEDEEKPNIDTLREKVNSVLENIIGATFINYYGDECWGTTFSTSKQFDKEYIQLVFEGLEKAISKHCLEKTVKATEVLEYDDRISDKEMEIPIGELEELQKLYEEIRKRFPTYLDPLFEATAKILNNNYVAPQQYPWNDDDLPF